MSGAKHFNILCGKDHVVIALITQLGHTQEYKLEVLHQTYL